MLPTFPAPARTVGGPRAPPPAGLLLACPHWATLNSEQEAHVFTCTGSQKLHSQFCLWAPHPTLVTWGAMELAIAKCASRSPTITPILDEVQKGITTHPGPGS